jgi:hypothetical protein
VTIESSSNADRPTKAAAKRGKRVTTAYFDVPVIFEMFWLFAMRLHLFILSPIGEV